MSIHACGDKPYGRLGAGGSRRSRHTAFKFVHHSAADLPPLELAIFSMFLLLVPRGGMSDSALIAVFLMLLSAAFTGGTSLALTKYPVLW